MVGGVAGKVGKILAEGSGRESAGSGSYIAVRYGSPVIEAFAGGGKNSSVLRKIGGESDGSALNVGGARAFHYRGYPLVVQGQDVGSRECAAVNPDVVEGAGEQILGTGVQHIHLVSYLNRFGVAYIPACTYVFSAVVLSIDVCLPDRAGALSADQMPVVVRHLESGISTISVRNTNPVPPPEIHIAAINLQGPSMPIRAGIGII